MKKPQAKSVKSKVHINKIWNASQIQKYIVQKYNNDGKKFWKYFFSRFIFQEDLWDLYDDCSELPLLEDEWFMRDDRMIEYYQLLQKEFGKQISLIIKNDILKINRYE